MPAAWTLGPMSAPPPTALIVSAPIACRRVAISWIVFRAESVPENPKPVGLNTPLSDSNIRTWLASWWR